MKHFYLKSLLCMVMVLAGMSAWADTATFDFTASSTATTLGITPSSTKSTGVSINGKSITVNTISCAFSKNSGNDAVFYTKTDGTSYQARIYNGDVVTLSAPTGYAITAIAINGSNLGNTYLSAEKGTYNNGAWSGESQTVVLTCSKSTPQINSITVTFSAASSVSAPTFSVAAGTYASTQSVELSCSTAGATIYYTTNGDTPTNSSTPYSSAISVSSTTTIKAIAYKDGAASNVAEAKYTILSPYTTLAAAHTAAELTGTTKVDCAFTFNNVLVTAVSGSNAYIVDENGDAAVIYTSGHGFAAGDKINGTAVGQMQIYQTYALELIGFKKTTEGLTVTSGNAVTPTTKTLASLTTADVCKLIKLEGVKITTTSYQQGTTKVTDGTNEIPLYNTFNAIGDMSFSTTASYNVVGIVPAYSVLEIAPRTAADISANLETPTHAFDKPWIEVAKNGTPATNTFTTNASSTTYTSSDESIATVSNAGVVTLKADATGCVTITATTAEDATYLGSTTSYSIAVVEGDGTKANPYTIGDVQAIVTASKVTGSAIAKENMYVQGTIVGSVNTSTGALITSSTATDHSGALALGTASDYITVNMPTNIQNVAALKNDLANINKTVVVKGNLRVYATKPGVHSISEISGITDLTVSSVGYATYYTNCAWVVPAGLTVKYVSAANAGTLTWEEYVEGATVPKETGVVVNGTAGNYPITYVNAGTAAPTNLLKGSVTDATTEGGDKYYMLSLNASKEAGSVGFYYGAADGAEFTNGAHKAYLALTSAQAGSVKGFAFDTDFETAISQIENGNLKFENGKFMENGKIVIMKNGVKYNAAGLQIR